MNFLKLEAETRLFNFLTKINDNIPFFKNVLLRNLTKLAIDSIILIQFGRLLIH